MDSSRFRQWSKQPLSWSSLNPGERNIFTASQLHVQNQKFRQDLQVIHKGIEDEKRCDNAARARKEIMLQNRFVRLSKQAGERIEKRSRCSLMGLQNFNFLPSSEKQPPNEDNKEQTVSAPQLTATNPANTRKAKKASDTTLPPEKAASKSSSDIKSTTCVDLEAPKKSVRFESATYESADSLSFKNNHQETEDAMDDVRHRPSISHYNNGGPESARSPLFSSEGNTSRERSRESTEHSSSVRPPPYNALAYYRTSAMGRRDRGFSIATATLPLHFDKSNQHKPRNQDPYHSRAVLARLKAVRSSGRRHHSHMTLCEAMDANAKQRKELASSSEPFGAEKAWQLLNCRYLRLTPSNVENLEGVCQEGGYDTSCNPHTQTLDPREEMKPVYKQLRESQVQIPHLHSAHKLK